MTTPTPPPSELVEKWRAEFEEHYRNWYQQGNERYCAFTGYLAGRTAEWSESQRLREALESANNMCRSAYSIAQRCGEPTNWQAFEARLRESLVIQHRAMFPEQRIHDANCPASIAGRVDCICGPALTTEENER